MPETAKELKINPYKAEENIEGGIIHLKQMMDRYDERYKIHYGLAAYNAGAGAVKKYNGIPPYRETQDYVRKVVRNYNNLKKKSNINSENIETREYSKEIEKRKSIVFDQGKKISFYRGGEKNGNEER